MKTRPLIYGVGSLFFSFVTVIATPPVKAPPSNPPSETPPQPTGLANLKILSDKMECYQEDQVCIATGNASIAKLDAPEQQTINADKLIAHFDKVENTKEEKKVGQQVDHKKESSGRTELSFVEAEGNVFMVKGPMIIQGDSGTYDPKTEMAHVDGDVKITKEENQVDGEHGEVDLKTGHYKIDPQKDKQVQALLYTKSKVIKDKKNKKDSLGLSKSKKSKSEPSK